MQFEDDFRAWNTDLANTISLKAIVIDSHLKTGKRQMAMEKERIENFRYQQRSKELEKAVTPFLKGRFQNDFVALNGHLIVQRVI